MLPSVGNVEVAVKGVEQGVEVHGGVFIGSGRALIWTHAGIDQVTGHVPLKNDHAEKAANGESCLGYGEIFFKQCLADEVRDGDGRRHGREVRMDQGGDSEEDEPVGKTAVERDRSEIDPEGGQDQPVGVKGDLFEFFEQDRAQQKEECSPEQDDFVSGPGAEKEISEQGLQDVVDQEPCPEILEAEGEDGGEELERKGQQGQ